MRYLISGRLLSEALEVGAALGSMPPTFLRPALEPDTLLALEPVDILPCGPFDLLLASRTASWCLLDKFECGLASDAQSVSFGALQSKYRHVREDFLREFYVRLFQRGLLRINGKPGIDPDILSGGALHRDANLVEILVTQKCNLACHYCLAEAGPDMPHMHPEIAYRAVDEAFKLPEYKPLAIQLSGGEPFVNFKLFKNLVEYIDEKQELSGRSVTVCTQSNGTLINDEIAEFIRAHEVAIGVSIDGPSWLNNRSRPMLGGGPSHDKTIRGIRTLQQHGIKFGTILVLNRSNVAYPKEIANFLVELGIESTKINPISMIGDAQTTWDAMAITSDEYFEFLTAFIQHIVGMDLPLQEANLAEYLKYLTRRVHDYRCMRSNCGAGRSFFLVDAKGDVYPCAHSAGIGTWRIGTIEEAEGDLINLGMQNPIVSQFRDRLVEEIPDTGRCPWRHFCEGGCGVNAYQKFGTILAPDSLCSFYERIYPYLLELLATKPDSFQNLLNLTFGKGQVAAVSFELGASNSEIYSGTFRSQNMKEMTHVR